MRTKDNFAIAIHDLFLRIKHSDIGYRMATGAFWSFTGTALAKFIVLVASIVCAHILGKAEYGELGMVRSTINMFVVLGSAGLGLTATKYISEYRREHKRKVASIYWLTNGFALVSGIIVTIAVWLFAPLLATFTLKAPHLVTDIRLGALLLFFTVINGAQTGTLSGLEDFKSIALNTLIGSIAESVFMLIGAYHYGVTGAILGFGTGFIASYIANNISIHRNFRQFGIDISPRFVSKEDYSLLYKYSLPAALSGIMVMPTYWIVRSLLVRSNGFDELAVFEAADQWKTIILFIPGAVSQIILPILSSMTHQENDKFWKVLKLNLAVNGGISLLIASILCVCSPLIMGMYGKGYSDIRPIVFLSMSTILSSMANVVGLSIASRAKMWVGFSFNALWAAMLIGFSWLFLNLNMGAAGIALGVLASYFVHAISQLIYLYETTKRNA